MKMIDIASRITLFMVAQSGPLSFTFKDRLGNKLKTSIGSELKCSCFPGKNDHCIHTLYVLLKVFKVPQINPLVWQAAYVDSELSDLLTGKYAVTSGRSAVRPNFLFQ
jgi:E3 ubiquitin-protein ligase ZSWIM2